eukprot:CAMPEP_0172190934 /NCGR_PEP_ID=MMETSP1050-20130122/23397_1 /TAXON_ID=233186 /ORGANISM="Cryptomonas curvata, Strain CCAP979/52" /LENGTH=160 /DNA_ID=CAMNT_0012865879 /DNA_START=164 /DNA_END=643 /DNA_ORIENTATION=-
MARSRGSKQTLAFMIPDVEWWDSQAIGWTGSLPVEERPAHGLIEQLVVDGVDNSISCFGLLVSLRATLPVLNGIIFPPAPEFVERNLFPFIAYCAEPYLNAVRARFPYSFSGLDIAVFPALCGLLLATTATSAVGAELPGSVPPGNRPPLPAGRLRPVAR